MRGFFDCGTEYFVYKYVHMLCCSVLIIIVTYRVLYIDRYPIVDVVLLYIHIVTNQMYATFEI